MSKLALITGASSGIGFELAKAMAAEGFDILLVARSHAKMLEIGRGIEKQYDVKTHVVCVDLAQARAGEALFEATRKYHDQIEYVCNNAGFGEVAEFKDQNLSVLTEMLQLNIMTLTESTRLFGQLFADRKSGSILNVASTAAFQPGPYMSAYYASKSYVLSFSNAVRYELAQFNVNVSTLCPGPTTSGFQARAKMTDNPFLKSSAVMSSEDVAKRAVIGWLKNQAVIIPGPLNLFGSIMARFTPVWLTNRLVARLNKSRS